MSFSFFPHQIRQLTNYLRGEVVLVHGTLRSFFVSPNFYALIGEYQLVKGGCPLRKFVVVFKVPESELLHFCVGKSSLLGLGLAI